jgi:hypothetical protein
MQTTPAPSKPLIPLLHLQIALPRPQHNPLALYQRRSKQTLDFAMKEEEILAVTLDPLCRFLLHEYTPINPRNLTQPSLLVQGRWSRGPCKPDEKLAMAVVQICSPAPFSTDPHIVELARVSRIRLVQSPSAGESPR